jgi:hypothetical protein
MTSTNPADFYIRENTYATDTPRTKGAACGTPDIIIMPLNEVDTRIQDLDTIFGKAYESTIGVPMNANANTKIYVRTKNMGGVGSGKVRLYYADPATHRWGPWIPAHGYDGTSQLDNVDVELINTSNDTSVSCETIDSNQIAVSKYPFQLKDMPHLGHYCLIAIATAADGEELAIPYVDGDDKLAEWVQQHHNVGWHNVEVVRFFVTLSGSAEAAASFAQVATSYGFGNINRTSGYFHIQIQGTGFDPDTLVHVQCKDQHCPINQSLRLPAPNIDGHQLTGFDVEIPAQFSGNMDITVTSPSDTFPSGASLVVGCYRYPGVENERDRTVARLFAVAKATEAEPILHLAMLIQLGDCTLHIIE